MSSQEIDLTLSLFPSPPANLPPTQQHRNNRFMAIGSTTPSPSSSRPELALYYFNSPTMLPQHKKPIPLMPSNTPNVDVVMADGKGPETRKRERSPLAASSDSEKGNKRKTPRKMRSSPFLAAGHFFQAFSTSASLPSPAVAASATSPKADGTTGVRNGDTVTSPTSTSPTNNASSDNNAEMETVKVISRAVRQRVAQSSSALSAASAVIPEIDTAAPARTVEVECTSPASSTATTSVPPAPSSSSSKSPFKKRRRVVRTTRQSSPLRNPPLLPSDFLTASASSSRAASPAPSKDKKIVKRKPVVWEKRPLIQKVLLKEFERTPHGAEILRRGAKAGIAFLEEQRQLVRAAEQSGKPGRKSTSSDEDEVEAGVVVKSRSKEVSSMRQWGRIVKTALAGPLKEMAGPVAGDGRPPMPMIRAW